MRCCLLPPLLCKSCRVHWAQEYLHVGFCSLLCLNLQLSAQLGRGKRRFSKMAEKQVTSQKHQRELDEMKRLIPDRLTDPLLNVGVSTLVHAALTHRQQCELASSASKTTSLRPCLRPNNNPQARQSCQHTQRLERQLRSSTPPLTHFLCLACCPAGPPSIT